MILKLPLLYTLNCFFNDREQWKYDDQGRVLFKDVSLPANVPPESIVKVTYKTSTPDTPACEQRKHSNRMLEYIYQIFISFSPE